MRFPTEFRRFAADYDAVRHRQEQRRSKRPPRAVDLELNSQTFYGRVFGVTVGVVLILAALGVARGADGLSAKEAWRPIELVSESGRLHARLAVEREVCAR